MAFYGLLGLLCLWVLTLPVFPSQDGPMHLYYAHILGSLLRAEPGYQPFFFVRTLFPPYAVHYYMILGLGTFFAAAVVEKVIVCIILATLACGFRFWARVCGPSGDLASLFLLPLLLSWPLGMGFFNYVLSLGLAMWAMGCWWRARTGRGRSWLVGYVALVAVMTFTHPVPVLIVIALSGADLAVRLLARFTPVQGRSLVHWVDLVAFALAGLSLVYILRFTDRHRIEQNTSGSAVDHVGSLARFLKLSPLAMFAGPGWSTFLYRAGLYTLLLGALAAGFYAAWRARGRLGSFLLASPWLFLGLVTPIVLVLIPSDMNGSHFFSDRLLVVAWIFALLAASTVPRLRAPGVAGATGLATLLTLGVLLLGEARIRPVAEALAADRAHPFRESRGAGGVFLGANATVAEKRDLDRLSFNPRLFAAAYAFTDTDTVMLNSPWLDLPILPLATHGAMFNHVYGPGVLDSPHESLVALERDDPARRHLILGSTQFLIFSTAEDEGALLGAEARSWLCQPWSAQIVCTRRNTP